MREGKVRTRRELANRSSQLRRLIPTGAEGREITTQVKVAESDAQTRAIREVAERFGADMICRASHGRSGLSRTIIGSVAQKVMAQTTRPVLVVRGEGSGK